ncbi:MAG: MarR family transcriptional regulator [Actinomycetia bacterium]|nr:MarR family transcriptional regulator [Actinomycetes bacterium]
MSPPRQQPVGLRLAGTAKAASPAFDPRLAAARGSLPVWLVLLALRSQACGNQRELARAVGIQGATLSHHLDGMERGGLLTRRRDPANRRMHLVELTPAGEVLFDRLRGAAVEHDTRRRDGISDDELARLADLLDRIRRNVESG